jgi:hypothetical protein
MRTFTFAGSSVLNGKLKIRYANDILRVKTLEKAGHAAIDLQPMPEAMTKLEIVTYMLDTDFAGDDNELYDVITAEKARLEGKNKRGETAAVTAVTAVIEENDDVADEETDEETNEETDEVDEIDDIELELLRLVEDEAIVEY